MEDNQTISNLLAYMMSFWKEIDFNSDNVISKVWKNNSFNIILINQVVMLIGELGEILRDLYLEEEDDNHRKNSNNPKDAGNVLLHALMIAKIICDKEKVSVRYAIDSALEKMAELSFKYRKMYGIEK